MPDKRELPLPAPVKKTIKPPAQKLSWRLTVQYGGRLS
jgi:hypothetical protein